MYKYTVIWSNSDGHGKLVSWIGTTHKTEEEANETAAQVAHELWDTMPALSWMVFKHLFSWRTVYKDSKMPF